MADAANGDARVTYTVKEILADMDRRHSESLADLTRDVGALKADVAELKAAGMVAVAVASHDEQVAALRERGSSLRVSRYGVLAAVLAAIISLPSALWYIGHA